MYTYCQPNPIHACGRNQNFLMQNQFVQTKSGFLSLAPPLPLASSRRQRPPSHALGVRVPEAAGPFLLWPTFPLPRVNRSAAVVLCPLSPIAHAWLLPYG